MEPTIICKQKVPNLLINLLSNVIGKIDLFDNIIQHLPTADPINILHNFVASR